MLRILRVESLESRRMFAMAPVVPGDANADGTVNGLDIAAVSSHWLEHDAALGDVNTDGIVNGLDVTAIASHWLQTAVTAAQPEIQLDATNTATLHVDNGGAQFQLASHQYLTEPNNAALNTTFNGASQLTISFQLTQTTLGLDRTILSRWNFGSGSGTLAIGTGGHVHTEGELSVWLAAPNGNYQTQVYTSGAHLVASREYAVAIVFDGSQATANRVAIYIDGVAQSLSLEGAAAPVALASSNSALDVGRWGGNNRYFDGDLRNLQIWNVAKSATDVSLLNWQSTGLVQNFPLTESSGVRTDTVAGAQLLDPTGVGVQQSVTQWDGAGTLPTTFTVSPAGYAPGYVASSALNGLPALSFNGLNNALKYAGSLLPTDDSGDVFIVARFSGGGDYFEGDTLFSAANDTTTKNYVFFASYNGPVQVIPPSQGGGIPLARLRFRNGDTYNDDIRGSAVVLQANTTYVFHFFGLGAGLGWGITVNGAGDGPYYHASSDQSHAQIAGSWFGDSPLTNLTIGNFERSDGPQGWFAGLLSEIDVYGGTAAQPVLSAAVSASIVDYLMAKYGATRLGNDE